MIPLITLAMWPTLALAVQVTFNLATAHTALAQAQPEPQAHARGQSAIETAMIPKPAKLPIIPEPAHYTFGSGSDDDTGSLLCLAPDFTITLSSELSGREVAADVRRAAERTREKVLGETHQWLSVGRGSEFWTDTEAEQGEGSPDTARSDASFKPCTRWLGELQLSLNDKDNSAEEDPDEVSGTTAISDERRLSILGGATAPVPERNALEKYELTVPLEGPATLKANAALGLLRGLTTFEHLFYRLDEGSGTAVGGGGDADANADGDAAGPEGSAEEEEGKLQGRVYAPFAPYSITDEPVMGWRGLMLDTARNYLPIKDIKRVRLCCLILFVVFGARHGHLGRRC